MTLEQIFQLQRTKTNQELSDIAMQSLSEKLFTGKADEITSENGNVVFRFGGYEYKLWYFSILSAETPLEILDAVLRARDAYESRKDKK